MRNQHNREELYRQIEAFLHGTLDDAAGRELAESIAGDAEARRVYIEYMDLHANLTWQGQAQKQIDAVDPSAHDASSTPFPAGSLLAQSLHATLTFFTKATPLSVTVTGLLLASIVMLVVLVVMPPPADTVRASTPAVAQPQFVAKVTGTSADCTWGRMSIPVTFGANLFAGQDLLLSEGLVEFTFRNGARVILEGPAEFRFVSSAAGSLKSGRLSAKVPQSARGFVIHTAAAKVVDLGTEFGVEVDEAGRAEVHVFRGKVDTFPEDADGTEASQVVALVTGRAARFSTNPTAHEQFIARPDQFEQELPASSLTARPRLIARYSLDESGTTIRDSVGTFHGTRAVGSLSQGSPATRFGEQGKAFIEGTGAAWFLSDSRHTIDLGKPEGLDFRPGTDEFSVSAWVCTFSGGTIIGKAAAANRQYQFHLAAHPSRLAAQLGGTRFVAEGPELNDDRVHHVAMCVTTTRVVLYVDGEPVLDEALATFETNPSEHVYLGARTGGDGFRFNAGWIDDIQVYRGALSDADVKALAADPGRIITALPRRGQNIPAQGNALGKEAE